jgi:pentatricopeptide repeat protein
MSFLPTILKNASLDQETHDVDPKGLNTFLRSAVTWPRQNRQGQVVATASYIETAVGLLEDLSGHYSLNPDVWRSALLSSSQAARYESEKGWLLVSQCCKHLMAHNYDLNTTIVAKGLKSAFKTKDAELASEIIMRVFNSSRNSAEDVSFHHDIDPKSSTTFIELSKSDLFRSIELCINNKRPELANAILSKCSCVDWLRMPKVTLSELTTAVITGYAQSGDLSSAERIFQEMEFQGLKKR